MLPNFDDVGSLSQGCYITNAMVSYIECNGFIGKDIVKVILNMPYQLIYASLFGISNFLNAPWLLFLAALAWAPIGYFSYYILKNLTKRLSGTNNP